MKGQSEKTKVVVRHLPPTISQVTLMEQIDVAFARRYNWVSFRPGKNSQKHQSYSRAYIDFKRPEDVIEFAEFFNGHLFVNEKGTQFRAIVEYAPSQGVPKQWSKKDGREGTILKDPAYLEFLELISKPAENLPSAEIQLERREAERAGATKDAPIITPLMDFVRQKRAAKSGSRRILANGKLSRRAGASGSPSSSSSKRSSDKKRVSTTMYVLRDSAKNTSAKDKSTYILVPKRDDQHLSDNAVALASASVTEVLEDESGISGITDAGKKKILLLKGKEKEIPTQTQNSSIEKDKRPPRPQHVQLIVKDANGVSDDKLVGNDLHGVSGEKQEKRTRNKDRPDRVWTPLRRSDGSYASDESLSSASQSTQSVVDSSQGSLGDVKVDPSNSRSGEVKTLGSGRSIHSSLDNGSLKHFGRRGPSHAVRDVDGSSGEGKPSKRVVLLVMVPMRSKSGFKSQVLVLSAFEMSLFCRGMLSPMKFWSMQFLYAGGCLFLLKQMVGCEEFQQRVLDALGESIPCVNYDSWMVYVPEGEFLSRIGPTEFYKDLETYAGPNAVQEWKKLLDAILPLSSAAMALPPLSIRGDLGVISTAAARYAPSLLKSFAQMGPQGAFGATKLLRPFSEIVDSLELKDPFIRNWVDLLAFLLAGVKSNGILSAEMIYMFAEWYKPGCSLEYPLHGSGAVVDALVRGLQKFGGRLSLKSHVEKIVVENNRAVGIKLKSGQFIRARKAVISNASMWDTLNLLPREVLPKSYVDRINTTPQCESFMHLHLGFAAEGIREDLGIHHIVVNDWDRGVDADQNVVLISVPSVLSPDLAPPGKHILHAYTPGTEPFELWKGLDRRSEEYKQLKAERSEVMWKAVERALGPCFSRDKCEVKLVGTPLTHQRFLRRNRGTYGPAIEAGKDTFPGHSTPISQLYCCGDSTFPGIGVPAVAASGAIVANSLVSVSQHSQLLDAIGI
ncbi:hypothetical protein GH714_005707 [Hevea brasiliensis]|uniref:UPF3 domain-containing protein n=1 Tax=Hevea brasiliensis TaxID=3981 RepID=A0A6A6KY04_HEVBR|nr:hypothetical protein GH714_005707 [Hevea brasiliensis]